MDSVYPSRSSVPANQRQAATLGKAAGESAWRLGCLGAGKVGVPSSMHLFPVGAPFPLHVSPFPGEPHHPSSLSLANPSFMQHVFTKHLPCARPLDTALDTLFWPLDTAMSQADKISAFTGSFSCVGGWTVSTLNG